jgi:hypothetical protein
MNREARKERQGFAALALFAVPLVSCLAFAHAIPAAYIAEPNSRQM